MKKKVNSYLLLSIIPAVLLVLCGLSLLDHGLILFPEPEVRTGNYDDGFSKIINFRTEDDKITLEYVLHEGSQYPFAGFFINTVNPENGQYLDISSYKYLNFRIKTTSSKDLVIYMLFFVDDLTVASNPQSYRYLEQSITLNRNAEQYTLNLDNFVTSLWWYNSFHTSEEELGQPQLKTLFRLQFQNGALLPLEVKDAITLESVTFKRSYFWLYIITVALVLLEVVILSTGAFMRRNQKTIITYKPLEAENSMDNDTKRVVSYITNNYAKPELTIENIYAETGITPAKISTLLKNNYDLSFKQFLNNIRLAEARRLLLETDYHIIEIAFKVGYNTVSHFNRLFKKVEDLTPKQYRKEKKK